MTLCVIYLRGGYANLYVFPKILKSGIFVKKTEGFVKVPPRNAGLLGSQPLHLPRAELSFWPETATNLYMGQGLSRYDVKVAFGKVARALVKAKAKFRSILLAEEDTLA